jgi:hypothetical protein
MFVRELLLDGRAFSKGIQNNILHTARILGNPPSPVKRDSQASHDVMGHLVQVIHIFCRTRKQGHGQGSTQRTNQLPLHTGRWANSGFIA